MSLGIMEGWELESVYVKSASLSKLCEQMSYNVLGGKNRIPIYTLHIQRRDTTLYFLTPDYSDRQKCLLNPNRSKLSAIIIPNQP